MLLKFNSLSRYPAVVTMLNQRSKLIEDNTSCLEYIINVLILSSKPIRKANYPYHIHSENIEQYMSKGFFHRPIVVDVPCLCLFGK